MDWRLTDKQTFWLKRILRMGFAIGVSVVLTQFSFHFLESLTYDLRVQFQPKSPTSGQVETVAIDTDTITELDRAPTIKDHNTFLEELLKLNPRFVVYLIDPQEIEGSPEERQAFAETAERFNSLYYAANMLPAKGREEEMRLPAPLNSIPVYAGPRTSDQNIFAKDNVTRRFIFSYEGVPTLHPIIASTYNKLELAEDYQGLFPFLETLQGYIDFRPPGTYKAHSFINIANGKIPAGEFEGKVVFIGKDTTDNSVDYIRTPYSKDILSMTTLEMHANIMDTLIENSAPIPTPPWHNMLITAIISIITLYVVLTVRPGQGLLILISTVVLFTLISYIAFSQFDIWIAMAHPLLAIFIFYYFFIPYRLIMENRRSWEYYQRNRLLTQVEELKSNFLRMMSHDLKTPLARIQGMADVVLSERQTLTEKQTQALENINRSSEELAQFIASILNLGRIESKDIKLQLKSKDINTLLTDVIYQLDFHARKKDITIISEFEPLFSVKVDEDLLRQVFSNLIENAIKYSPEGSKVLVSTEEINGRVVIQVADQGIGVPEIEVNNIFTKFYRSAEAKNSGIKGSGLGLYLAKYFVELHNGSIQVESQIHQGSTFTVEIPMDLDGSHPQPHQLKELKHV